MRHSEPPPTVKNLRSSMEFHNVSQRFVSNSAQTAAPLYAKLTKTEQKQFDHLSTKEIDALANLQQ